MWRRRRRPTLAVLSYHSWEVGVSSLREDVTVLRRAGWKFLSATDALAFIRGDRVPGPRCALLTTDDGHVEDEEWAPALRALECPAVTFICSALVPFERREFYRKLDAAGEFTVEDHGSHHAKHASSSRVLGYADGSTPTSTKAGETVVPGAPLLPLASEVATRRFVPDPEALDFVTAAGASVAPAEIRSDRWRSTVGRELVGRRLAVRRFGRLYLRGRFETGEEYETRIAEYLRKGRTLFEQTIGRAPRLYAYTWWAGNKVSDDILRGLGYAGTFREVGAIQPADGRAFAIPRIPVGPSTARPLELERLPTRPRLAHPDMAGIRAAAKRALGIG